MTEDNGMKSALIGVDLCGAVGGLTGFLLRALRLLAAIPLLRGY